MSTWATFEIECTKYLNNRFKSYANFLHQGGSDSTVSDILVETNNGDSFYIDVKHCPAQCGQFVLHPDITSKSFIYGSKNDTRLNIYAQKIIDYMNSDFESFRNAGTAGKEINMPDKDDVFANWVIDKYQNNGTRFFITNNYELLPLGRFKQYFDISAKYRIKRSGSAPVGKSNIHNILSYIQTNYPINNFRIDNKKLFITSPDMLHNHRFIFNAYEYMFSSNTSANEYEIRKLSNTYNANVIFSIKLKNDITGISDAEFISQLSIKQ